MTPVNIPAIALTTFIFISNTIAESYTCNAQNICSESINCTTSPCSIICESDSCNSITINTQSVALFTLNSTNTKSTSMIINANENNALQINIYCIGNHSCTGFNVEAGGDVFIEAVGSFAISGGTWNLHDASSISISCASNAESACNPDKWNVPAVYNQSLGASLGITCYGFGCRDMTAYVRSPELTTWNVVVYGCEQCQSADECIDIWNFECMCSEKGIGCRDDYWTGKECMCSEKGIGCRDCGCDVLLIYKNATVDGCADGLPDEGDPWYAYVIGIGLCVFVCLLFVCVCYRARHVIPDAPCQARFD
eukprot:254028_1